MLGFLESGECKLPDEAFEAVQSALNGVIKLRKPIARKFTVSKPFIRIVYTAHGLKSIGLKSILMDNVVTGLFPIAEDFREYVICKRLIEPIGKVILNYRRVAQKLNVAHCQCRELFDVKYRPNNECVLTGDLSLVCNADLRQLIANGPNFRDHTETDTIDAIRQGLNEFISWHSETNHISSHLYKAWRSEILSKCASRLEQTSTTKHTAKLQNPAVEKYLKFLLHHLVLVPVDKAAGNIAFVCKKLYVQKLSGELKSVDGAYEPEAQTADEILEFHRDFLQPRHLWDQDKLPYLYWTPKFHKNPTGQRFIAGSSSCSTTLCSKVLSDMLTYIMRTLREKDNEHIRKTGVRRYFTVESFDEVSLFLGKWQRITTSKRVYTGDFSTMYTKIPHDDLIRL